MFRSACGRSCLHVHCLCVVPVEDRRGCQTPGTAVSDSCELPWCWELNPGPWSAVGVPNHWASCYVNTFWVLKSSKKTFFGPGNGSGGQKTPCVSWRAQLKSPAPTQKLVWLNLPPRPVWWAGEGWIPGTFWTASPAEQWMLGSERH